MHLIQENKPSPNINFQHGQTKWHQRQPQQLFLDFLDFNESIVSRGTIGSDLDICNRSDFQMSRGLHELTTYRRTEVRFSQALRSLDIRDDRKRAVCIPLDVESLDFREQREVLLEENWRNNLAGNEFSFLILGRRICAYDGCVSSRNGVGVPSILAISDIESG